MQNNKTVVLIHGFNKNESDMCTLKSNLTDLGYYCVTINLPTRFGTLDDCNKVLQSELVKVLSSMAKQQQIHLVGHSMGGLIIRNYLAKHSFPNLGRCVLIATPNSGSKLADLAHKIFPPVAKVFKPISELKTNGTQIPKPVNIPCPEIGVIAGNKCNLLLGILLPNENDGRVEVDSTKLEGMKDFIVKRFGHMEIHHKFDIAILIDNFLQNGTFQGQDEPDSHDC
ncbi:alpha/beta fold hydrolase [Desulfosporosinus sp. Sb-LF]|uniref:alpha/beta fold hydrolase n=1 Tax=Desulfosporosinus sp. Sb-LF TaxID=2560027 RepID=UPI00107F1FCA|nr:alpha/beta fold hydrolase [Desulfosporosinus sp. Sb-LF]TGE32093.1 alpha/beta fold hydrolase [Desulfosporosinus sp. Sb-LF]